MKGWNTFFISAVWLLSAAIAAESSGVENKPERLQIVATLFPQYDFTRRIAGDKADVRLLLPPGAESHSFEPTPADMRDIASADIFIYTGEYMEPWAKRLADSTAASEVNIVDVSVGMDWAKGMPERDHDRYDEHDAAEHEGHGNDNDGHNHTVDPHIWLDPVMAGMMAETIGVALAEKDMENAEFYRENTRELCNELKRLDKDILDRISGLPRRLVIFGDRFAFAHFFSRYGLKSASPYKFCAAGAEPGLRAVIDTIALIKQEHIKYVYVEAMTTSRMADAITRETGAKILHVDSLHNPPLEKQRAGISYLSAMRANLDAFSKGLE